MKNDIEKIREFMSLNLEILDIENEINKMMRQFEDRLVPYKSKIDALKNKTESLNNNCIISV